MLKVVWDVFVVLRGEDKITGTEWRDEIRDPSMHNARYYC